MKVSKRRKTIAINSSVNDFNNQVLSTNEVEIDTN